MACPSIKMKSGFGPQIGLRAFSEGIMNVDNAAVPSLTVSCRRTEYDRTAADMCRDAAVYVERPVLTKNSQLSNTPRVKTSHSRARFFRRLLNKACALPSYSTLQPHLDACQVYLPRSTCSKCTRRK